MLFTAPEKFADWIDDQESINALIAIKQQAGGMPEQINDNPNTAPSKRIAALVPQYKKTLHGPLIAEDIGLDAMCRACPHFNHWFYRLEALAG
ncbi:MAG: DUF4276 family protein [Gammaproteobacteria bacterium]|nr:DUF4276 family protein [Gammaproteobacteria bacterium]